MLAKHWNRAILAVQKLEADKKQIEDWDEVIKLEARKRATMQVTGYFDEQKYNWFCRGAQWFAKINYTLPKQVKPFIVANVRELLNQFNNAEISFSRMVEIMNEMAGHSTKQEVTDKTAEEKN